MPKPVAHVINEMIRTKIRLHPGDFIEGCDYHPRVVLSVTIDHLGDDDNVESLSLVNGSIGYCSAISCGLRKLSFQEVEEWMKIGPRDRNGVIEYWRSKTNDLE